MSGNASCAGCGAQIPADAPEGLCRSCLLRNVLEDTGLAVPEGSAAPEGGAAPRRSSDDGETVTYRIDGVAFSSDRYSDGKFHKRGGMGEIWRVRDSQINRVVALKRLRKRGRENRERFLAEAQITGQLEHPGIVPVHDLGVDDEGQAFYTMRFLDGSTLSHAIDNFHEQGAGGSDREFARRGLLEHFLRACDAVHYAHKKGVIHRDIKPDNLMIGSDGETWVVDWGLAKVLSQPELPGPSLNSVTLTSSGASSETRYGSVLGTPAYMPPELAEGFGSEVGPSCDVYLLGATLYKILTGHAPRRGRSNEELVELARTVSPAPPREYDRQVPRPLEAICLKAMARQPANRYQSVQELAWDVRRYLANEPVSVCPESLWDRGWRWVNRHRDALARAAGLLVIGVLLLFGVAGYSKARRLEAVQTAEDKVREFHAHRDQALFQLGEDQFDPTFVYYRPAEGLKQLDQALEASLAGRPELARLQRESERERINLETYDLLLLKVLAQLNALSAAGGGDPAEDDEQIAALLDDLERARQLAGDQPTAEFFRLRSRCLRLQGQFVEARRDAEQIQTAPLRALDYFVLGESHRLARPAVDAEDPIDGPLRRDLTKAIAAYREALRLEPDHFWSLLQLARCYLSQGTISEAEGIVQACIALKPDSPYAYSVRGLVRAAAGQYDQAVADLDFALSLDPAFHAARLNRGWVRMQQGQYVQAESDLQRVLQDAELHQAAYYLGRLNFLRRDLSQAHQYYAQFAKAAPSFPVVHKDLATVALLANEEVEGLDELTRYLELTCRQNPDIGRPNTYLYRAVFVRSLVTGLLAERIAEERHQFGRESDQAQALTAQRRKLLELALREIGRAEAEAPSAELYFEKGAILKNLGKQLEPGQMDEMEAYARGLQLDPKHLKILRARGFAWWVRGESDKARGDLEQAATLDPRNASEVLFLADSHALLGYLLAESSESVQAQQEAMRASLRLEQIPVDRGNLFKETYTVRINMATIYAMLARDMATTDSDRIRNEDLALGLLERVVPIARQFGEANNARQLIQGDPTFDALRELPRYGQIMEKLSE
ncbi:MAG: protein kinase [Pirellulaceae bacterium]|nr:protein kinase [Pirellulaceae bacterium]